MTLEQIAQQTMNYLDSVGVAADYDLPVDGGIIIITNKCSFHSRHYPNYDSFIWDIERSNPQKSPA